MTPTQILAAVELGIMGLEKLIGLLAVVNQDDVSPKQIKDARDRLKKTSDKLDAKAKELGVIE